jgi:hypothetical protein
VGAYLGKLAPQAISLAKATLTDAMTHPGDVHPPPGHDAVEHLWCRHLDGDRRVASALRTKHVSDARFCRIERVEHVHTYALTGMFTRGLRHTVFREVERPSVIIDAQKYAERRFGAGRPLAG